MKNKHIVRNEIIEKHAQLCSFRDVANLPEYEGIPPGTLCAIAKGNPIPKKWRKQLGMINPRSQRPPYLEIRRDNAASAARSITKNCGPAYARELIKEIDDALSS